jgi:hypothetical protein
VVDDRGFVQKLHLALGRVDVHVNISGGDLQLWRQAAGGDNKQTDAPAPFELVFT